MAKPRVFISHSAREPDAQALRDALAQALQNEGYRVLLDKTGLELGDNWRSKINLWIGGCDAAVVLLSQSALESNYVAYEASILAFRAGLDQNFCLIPIFIAPVDYDKVQASPLSPTRIHETQALIKDVPEDQMIQQVLAKLGQIESGTSPIEKQARYLYDLLQSVPGHAYEADAKRFGIDLGTWVPGAEVKQKLALSMMAAGLDGSSNIIRRIRYYFPKPEKDVNAAVNLLGSSWVDHRSVVRIPQAVKEGKSIGATATNPLTAKMYVIQAYVEELHPGDPWKVIEVDGITGENSLTELEDQIRESLSQELGVAVEDVDEELLFWMEEGEPTFIALPTEGIDVETINNLRAKFQGGTFFFLMGTHTPSITTTTQAKIEFLQPELNEADETYYCRTYERKRKVLTRWN